ncbi:tetratricopeptide repeat protein [Dongia sp.]|uniref:tetratricopeptide repeat protein n=1 Tax=Dongia sp. TaxID=1977262 RepID=UPI0035B0393A
MPLLPLLILALDIFMAVHVIRNGKTCWWISIILVFPLIGSLVYFFVEIFPTLDLKPQPRVVSMQRARWKQAQDSRVREREVRGRNINDVVNSGSINDKLSLADECMKRDRYADAIRLYESAREGFFVNAADVLLGLARAQLENGEFVPCRQTLRELAEAHPGSFAQERIILTARALAGAGDFATAIAELEALLDRKDSLEARRLEARYYYAEFLWKQGMKDRSLAQLAEVIKHGKLFAMTEEEEYWVTRAGEVQAALR